MSEQTEQHIEVEGTFSAVLPGTMFKVSLDKLEVLALISGKMRKHLVRLTAATAFVWKCHPTT